MSNYQVTEIGRQAILASLYILGPILGVALVVGILVSVFQAVTQIQEPTLTFIPKLAGTVLVFLFLGSWMLTLLVRFLQNCLEGAAVMTR